MAGIGFEFRKLLQKDTYWGIFQAYGYSGIVSSGPWILSIIGILIVGIYSYSVVSPPLAVVQFQVSITNLFMSSLVLLEGFAAGVPAVATDVGACRQLIYGLDAEDQALGAAGSVVGIADPQSLALAAVELLTNRDKWQAASLAGIRRVETYYNQEQMFARYRAVYEAHAWQA